MADCTCPVLFPTEEEFSDFYSYIRLVELLLPDVGMCKIIPPPSWFVRNYDIQSIDLSVSHAIQQHITGRNGVFSVGLFEVPQMSLQDFQAYANAYAFEGSVEERENKFWRHLGGPSGFVEPIYGADLPGTLFLGTESHPSWNLGKLESVLSTLDDEVPGVNTPMLYLGMWRAMFAYHVEDMDLYSINYLHYGEPKSW